MAESNNTEIAVVKQRNPLVDNLAVITKPENIQKYILGTKKNGQPRAVYDIIKDYTDPKHKKKKKKKKHDDKPTAYSLYLETKSGKKKKKKHRKKRNKYWHV